MSDTGTKASQSKYAAFLFDMDGTLLNSIAVVERVWSEWAVRHGFDPATFLLTVHGLRAVDVVTSLALPDIDPQHEAKLLLDAEMDDVNGIIPIPGAIEFLESLPRNRWAIVTSAPKALAIRRMTAAGIPFPDVMVTGEDVEKGKPSPACYLLGAERLGVDAAQCMVFEDAVAGIMAGEAAGADVTVITTTHTHPFETQHAAIAGYIDLSVRTDADGMLVLEPSAA